MQTEQQALREVSKEVRKALEEGLDIQITYWQGQYNLIIGHIKTVAGWIGDKDHPVQYKEIKFKS